MVDCDCANVDVPFVRVLHHTFCWRSGVWGCECHTNDAPPSPLTSLPTLFLRDLLSGLSRELRKTRLPLRGPPATPDDELTEDSRESQRRHVRSDFSEFSQNLFGIERVRASACAGTAPTTLARSSSSSRPPPQRAVRAVSDGLSALVRRERSKRCSSKRCDGGGWPSDAALSAAPPPDGRWQPSHAASRRWLNSICSPTVGRSLGGWRNGSSSVRATSWRPK
mmetsp:Transcript_74049/g.197096  ORF Transcript_74049/g.197096 Transcript_74049/m.197096 type:complete len:223 (-) Transcript_74049:241-909(-)